MNGMHRRVRKNKRTRPPILKKIPRSGLNQSIKRLFTARIFAGRENHAAPKKPDRPIKRMNHIQSFYFKKTETARK